MAKGTLARARKKGMIAPAADEDGDEGVGVDLGEDAHQDDDEPEQHCHSRAV